MNFIFCQYIGCTRGFPILSIICRRHGFHKKSHGVNGFSESRGGVKPLSRLGKYLERYHMTCKKFLEPLEVETCPKN